MTSPPPSLTYVRLEMRDDSPAVEVTAGPGERLDVVTVGDHTHIRRWEWSHEKGLWGLAGRISVPTEAIARSEDRS